METSRSRDTLAIASSDAVSMDDSSMATLEDFPSLPDAEAFRNQERVIDKISKENAELRRRVKRRTQALDTMRKAYIVDVDSLKRSLRNQTHSPAEFDINEAGLEGIPSLDFRPVLQLYAPDDAKLQMSPCGECGGTMEIIHLDDMQVTKLNDQVKNLREELVRIGEKVGFDKALAKSHRLKEEAVKSDLMLAKGAMAKEIMCLKTKLEGAGPTVVSKLSEEMDKTESRLRASNRRVCELEVVVAEMREKLGYLAQEKMRVAELEHHLLEGSNKLALLSAERDQLVKELEEAREVITSMEGDSQEAARANMSLEKTLREQEEHERRSTDKLRTLLNKTKVRELTLRAELAALREEWLQSELANGSDGDDDRAEKISRMSPTEILTVEDRDRSDLDLSAAGDKKLVLELSQKLQRKEEEEVDSLRKKVEKQCEGKKISTDQGVTKGELKNSEGQAGMVMPSLEMVAKQDVAAAGNDVLSGAHPKQGTRAAHQIVELRNFLTAAEQQVVKVQKEKKQLYTMWLAARAEQPDGSVDPVVASESPTETPIASPGDGGSRSEDDRGRLKDDGRISASNSAVAAEKSGMANVLDGEEAGDVMVQVVRTLEEDCRELRVAKSEARQQCSRLVSECSILKTEAQGLCEVLTQTQISLEQMRQKNEDVLHEANDAAGKLKDRLQTETAKATRAAIEVEEMAAHQRTLVEEVADMKITLEASCAAKTELERVVEQGVLQAERDAARAEARAAWAEAEGMRAEEGLSQRHVAEVAAAEKATMLKIELMKTQNEVARRRRDAAEHAEQMKEFCLLIGERARLEEEVASHKQRILNMETQAAKDKTAIDEYKLQATLLNTLRMEVLRLEEKLETAQKEVGKVMMSLDVAKEMRKVTEKNLFEKEGLCQALWAALIENDDASSERAAFHKPPVAPLEAYRVEEIMNSRNGGVRGANKKEVAPDPSSDGNLLDGEGRDASTRDKLEKQKPKEIKSWVQFRLHSVAALEHNTRVDSARAERALLHSVCNQRAAQISNVEEAMQQLETKRAVLEEANSDLMHNKEELTATVLQQTAVLSENCKELSLFSTLKMEHQIQSKKHTAVVKRLHDSEEQTTILSTRLKAAISAKHTAEMMTREAAAMQSRAMEEERAARREAGAMKAELESGQIQAARVAQRLQDLLAADKLRLATNRAVSTEVAYGDFTEDAPVQTTFLCPELTIRQAKRLPPVPGFLSGETVGRYFPAPGAPRGRDVVHPTPLERIPRPHTGLDGAMPNGTMHMFGRGDRRWKQGPCVSLFLPCFLDSARTTRGPLASSPSCLAPCAKETMEDDGPGGFLLC